MREGFFETLPGKTIGADLTGTLNAAAAGATAIVGNVTNFDPEVSANDILTFLDSAGARQFVTVLSRTDDTNLTLSQPLPTAISGATTFAIATVNSPYFIVRDAVHTQYPFADPVLGRIAGGLTAGYRMASPSASAALIDSITSNEGITINSIYVRNPYQHTWADTALQVVLFQVDDGNGNATPITQLGVNGRVFIPIENGEIQTKIYVPPLTTSSNLRWGLGASILNSYQNQNDDAAVSGDFQDQNIALMSNVNVPAAMDGQMLNLIVGCRFTYGFDITG